MIRKTIHLLFLLMPVLLLAQSPGGVSNNMTVWFRADAGTTGSPAVQTWTNQASNVALPSVTQATVANRATLNPGGYNFNPTLTFDGANDRYSIASIVRTAFVNTNRYNFYVVSRPRNLDAGRMVIGHFTSDASRFTFEQVNQVFHNNVSSLFTTVSINNPSLAEASFTGSALNWGNNGLLGSNAFSTTMSSGSATFYIGTQTGSNYLYNGDIAEIIMYNEANSATDHARIRSYLALKYGITLENQSYVASDGTTKMWDDTKPNAATYNKNIAGIGRDNNSAALNQKQSQSQNLGIQPVIAAGSFVDTNAGNTSTLANMEFLSWGDNNGTKSFDTSIASPGNVANRRFSAIWKVQKTAGFSNTVTVGIPVTSSNPVYLVRSTNDTFDAADTWVQLTQTTVNGVQYWATPTQINLADGEYFTFAGYVHAPGGVAGHGAWFRADTGVTLSGTDITRWDNQGNAASLPYVDNTGASATNKVTFNSNNVNFNPGVSFPGDNTDAFLRRTGTNVAEIASSSSYAHFTVARKRTVASVVAWHAGGGSATGSAKVGVEINSASPFNANFYIDHTTWRSTNPVNNNANNLFVISRIFSGGTANDFDNGAIGTAAVANHSATGNIFTIGASGFNQFEFAGDIMEVISYPATITLAEREKVNSYLGIKYGVTLGTAANPFTYYSSNGSTVWSPTTNAGYYNNVFGIGRDDISSLYQKQSRSENGSQKLIIGAGASLSNTNTLNANTLTDGQFLMVGDNNLAQSLGTPLAHVAPGGEVNNRFASIWRVQNTGSTGQVIVAWPKGISNLHLVRSVGDNTFDGTDTYIPMTGESTVNGVVYNTATVTFADGDYFTFAGYIHAPGGVTNALSYWYRADKSATNTGVGADVTSWTDFYSGSTIANQLGTNALPKYAEGSADYFNFNPGINFTADTQRLANVSVSALSSLNFDIFTFVKEGASTGNLNRVVNIGYNNTNTGGGNWDSPGIAANGFVTRRTNTGGGSYGPWRPGNASSTTIPSITYNTFTNTNFARAINGEANSAVQTNNAIGQTNGGFIFGDNRSAPYSGDDPGFIGHLGEVVIYGAGNLSATERRRVDSYLAIKYGITLDRVATENYLGSTGGIVWSGSVNSGYNNNIFGITHDEISALHQKQSKSVNANQKLIIGAGSSLADTNAANTNDLTNGQYLIVGDNNLTQKLHTALIHNAPGGEVNNRFEAIWKVQNTGSTGQVIVAWPKGISTLHLVRSTGNSTFDGTDTFIPMTAETTINGVVYNTATVTFIDGDYFTFAGYIHAPGGVSAAAWYRADETNTLFSNAGTTVAADNATVQQWNEFLGTGHNLIQNTAGSRPTFSNATTLSNFNPSVTFNLDYLEYEPATGVNIIDRVNGTLYTAGYFNVVGPAGIFGFHASMDYPGLHTSNNGLNNLMFFTGGPGYVGLSSNTFSSGNSFVAGANWQNGAGTNASYASSTVSLDGQRTFYNGSQLQNAVLDVNARGIRLGRDTNWGGVDGQINEAIIFENALTEDELDRVESYLSIKNGTTLVSRNYKSSSSAIVWNAASNNGYNNNIFGIARDNASILHQKQSHSTKQGQKLIIGNNSSLFNTNAANTNSLTNGQFLIVGDNGLAQTLNTPFVHVAPGGETNFRFASIWKTQNTGTVGQVIVAWPKGISNLHLVHSVGNDTFDGTDTFIPMTVETTVNGVVYNTATVTLNDGDYFTFAGHTNAPGGVVGQTVWLRADKDVTVAAGKVDAWANQGLSGGNAVPAYPATGKPNYVELSHNFNPVVMDNTTAHDGLVLPNVFTNTLQRALSSFVVQSQPTITQEVTMISYGNNVVPSSATDDPWFASNNATRLNIFWQSNGGASNQTYPNSLTRLNNIQTINSYFIPQYVGTSNTSLVNMVGMNGSRTSFNRNGNANSVMGNHLFVHQDGGNNNTSNSSISEVISYDKALTVDEQNRIDSYLAIKYGITLYNPGGTATPNYLGSASNVVWNSSTDATYNRNIFGIARADVGSFEQKVSKSVNAGTILTVAKNNDFVSSNSDAGRTSLSSDESYLLFGDNNNTSPTLVTPTEIGDCGELLGSETDIKLIARKWMVQRTNSVGVTYLQANLASYASTLNSDVYMFVANDANFTQNVKMIPGTKTGNNWTFAHNFDNENAIRYITFGGTFVAAPCEQCKGETYTLRTGYQWNQGLWANQTSNQKLNIALGNDADGTPLTASMYADYSENPSIEYVPTRYPQQYGGKWTMVRRYDNTTAKDRHRITLSQAMKASFQISNINTYLNNKNNFEVIGYCNGAVVMPRITYAYNTSYHTFEINGNQARGTMSWRGFVPNVSTANVRFDRPVDEIVIISAVERVNAYKTLRSSLYGDITLECAEVLEPNPDNVYVSHSFTQNTLATCGGETTMRIKVTNNNLCEDKTISLHQLLPAGLSYVPGSFNGNDLPAGTMAATTLAYSGNSLELSGLTLPRGEHWMYVDVANPGTAGTYPTQFTFEVTDGLDPAHTYSSSVKNLNYYNSAGSTPAAPSLELSIKDNVSCAENNDVITYRMKIDNPNVGGTTGAEILHMFDYDQTIQSVVFVSGEDENGVVTGSYPIDGSATPITPVGSSLFNLIDAVIPQGVSYIDITVNVGNSYDIAEVQALGISSSFLVGLGNGECAESGESISNEVNLQLCNACVKPGATGTPLGSSAGIRTKNDNSVVNWPVSVPNGYLVLDGAFKGMVITHMTTAQINALTPLKGMLVYDTDEQCVKLYRGAGANAPLVNPTRQGWVCIQRICVD